MEILNYREQSPTGNVVAIFDLTIPALGMTFRNWKLLRSKNGHLFPVSPSFSYEDEQGQKKWASLIEVSEKRKSDFNKAVLEALQPYLRGNDLSP